MTAWEDTRPNPVRVNWPLIALAIPALALALISATQSTLLGGSGDPWEGLLNWMEDCWDE